MWVYDGDRVNSCRLQGTVNMCVFSNFVHDSDSITDRKLSPKGGGLAGDGSASCVLLESDRSVEFIRRR